VLLLVKGKEPHRKGNIEKESRHAEEKIEDFLRIGGWTPHLA
jgi:hypothetical protein